MCMGMEFPFPCEFHGNGNTDMPKMGMGRVHVTMGMANFCPCAKIPISRLDANATQ